MKILYIARNIPVPGVKENNIILRVAKSIEEFSDLSIDVLFPREILPKMPFSKNKRIIAISKLAKVFNSLDKEITSLNYFRLPTLQYSYSLLNSFKWLNVKDLKELNEYQLIHAHNIMPDGKIGLELKKKYKIPLIVTVRNGDLDKISKLKHDSILYKSYVQVLQNADRIITHNYPTRKFVEGLNLNCLSIPHGIEEKYLLEEKTVKENIILFVGNMIPRKNLNWVVDSFKKIDNTKWKLIIIGDGGEYTKLKKSVENFKNIELKGQLPRDEVLKYMKKSKIFAMPSERETFGIVYLEAAASKCLVVGQSYTGIYGWLKDKEEGIFVANKNEFTTALKDLLLDQDKINDMALNGFSKVQSELLWQQQIDKYIKLYKGYE